MSNEVISTRVRLARNLKDYPFPCRLSEQGRKKVIEKVTSAIRDSNSSIASDFNLIKLDDLTEAQGVSLVERHLVSPEFISETEGRALLLSKDESMSIMINEEDHIRLQVITDGLSLEQAYDTADKLDTLLDENLEFAFDDKLGYLTQCPTNLGTGMRASVMLHLPALEKSRTIGRIAGNLSKLGLTIRGAYGEGSIFSIRESTTSAVTSFICPDKMPKRTFDNITKQLVSQEQQARERLAKSIDIQDSVSRSLGLLKSAMVMTHDEALKLLSNVRFGILSGQIKDVTAEVVDSLMEKIEPATLMVNSGKNLSAQERDIERAKILREALS